MLGRKHALFTLPNALQAKVSHLARQLTSMGQASLPSLVKLLLQVMTTIFASICRLSM